MAIVVFALSLVLILAGLWSGYMSLDLLPTPTGVLYALAGACAVAIAVLAFALGVAIRRIDALAALLRRSAPLFRPEAAAEVPPADATAYDAVGPAGALDALEQATEHPINENRAGHLPTLGEVEPEAEPPGPPALVGRYSAGGADYRIFSDGSIEAETMEGRFKFASMGEFKRFISDRREGRG